jgi:hypothetical protein
MVRRRGSRETRTPSISRVIGGLTCARGVDVRVPRGVDVRVRRAGRSPSELTPCEGEPFSVRRRGGTREAELRGLSGARAVVGRAGATIASSSAAGVVSRSMPRCYGGCDHNEITVCSSIRVPLDMTASRADMRHCSKVDRNKAVGGSTLAMTGVARWRWLAQRGRSGWRSRVSGPSSAV